MLLTAVVTYKLIPKQIEYKEKIVTQVQERVRTLTRIVVSPNGTTETIIDERKDTDTKVVEERQAKPLSKEYLLSSTMTYNVSNREGPIYGVGFSKRLVLGLYGGLYANTNNDIGLTLSYAF